MLSTAMSIDVPLIRRIPRDLVGRGSVAAQLNMIYASAAFLLAVVLTLVWLDYRDLKREHNRARVLGALGAVGLAMKATHVAGARGSSADAGLDASDRAREQVSVDRVLDALHKGGEVEDAFGQRIWVEPLSDARLIAALRERWAGRLDGDATTRLESSTGASLPVLVDRVYEQMAADQQGANRRRVLVQIATLSGLALLFAATLLGAVRHIRALDKISRNALAAAQERLRERQLLAHVAATTSNLVVITDIARRILWVNASFERATGWTLRECVGMSPRALLQGPHTDPDTVAMMSAKLARGEAFSGVELVNYDRHGQPYWVELEVCPVKDEDGDIESFIAIESVISDRKKLLADLTAARDEAQRANLAKTRFLARAGHELRTPLNGILGLAQVLLVEGALVDARQHRLVRTIAASGTHMAALLDDMLDVSRIESSELAVERSPVDLRRLVESVAQVLGTGAAELNIAMDCHVADDARFAEGDPLRVRQIVLNLLSNAIKYNRSGGRVELRTSRSQTTVDLQVRDTGHGLNPQQLEQLFEPFNRLGAERTQVPGTGIGLVIARRLAELMRGSISVGSVVGEGTTFTLRLPAMDDTPDTDDASAFVPLSFDSAQPSGTVLYVEDDPVNAMVFEACLLQRPALRLRVEQDGRAALRALAEERPSVVVLDLNLPDMDGFELAERLRALPGFGSLPVCLLSADGSPQVAARARACGFARVWTKPFHVAELLAELDALLEGNATLREAPRLPAADVLGE
jgi:PAS domain S-box-containing protein